VNSKRIHKASKHQREALEIKSKLCQIKNSTKSLSSRLNQGEGTVSGLEGKADIKEVSDGGKPVQIMKK
jgi:hypothetical protein